MSPKTANPGAHDNAPAYAVKLKSKGIRMDRKEYIATISALVRLQTYQCYKGKALKKDVRTQRIYIKALLKSASFEPLTDKETLNIFQNMNCYDIQESFVVDALKLKT